MTRRPHRRHGRISGFIVSALIHVGAVGLVLLGVRDQGNPGTEGGGQMVPVNLNMFEIRLASVVTKEPLVQPSPEPVAEPEPEAESEPIPDSELEPEPEPIPEPGAEPEPVQEPEPALEPEPKPESKPKPEPKPKPKPKRDPKPKPTPQPKPQPAVESAALPSPQPVANRTQAETDRPEAKQAGDTVDAGSSQAALGFADIPAWENRYLDGLRRAIERNRYYPRKAHRRGREGQVLVSFVVQADGEITDIRISRGSDWRSLDKAAVNALKRLGRHEPIPAAFGRKQWALRVPINFSLK